MRRLFTILILSLSGMAAFGQSGEVKRFANEVEVPRITVAEAKKGFDEGTVIFVDARTEITYKEEHIKGALHISGSDESISSLPKGKRIIVYCS